ncbi:MAG: peptidoglycan-binding protein [Symploca sp. SIO2C1]|nr:peptidoglycan-binding protein [Symploca sp. SIO2C1]
METLAYFHLTATEQTPANLESKLNEYYSLTILQELKQPKLLSWVLISLSCLAVMTVLSTASPALALNRGDSGTEVTSLQENLKTNGYYEGPVTGFYGSLTEEAVINFQNAQGLVIDGIAGSATQSALVSLKEDKPQYELQSEASLYEESQDVDNPVLLLKRGERSALVASLQRNMQTSGYYNGPITGYYGSFTEAAVIAFQKAKGLQVDGIAGPATRAALESSSAEGIPPETVENSSFFNEDPFLEDNDSFQQQGNLEDTQNEYPSFPNY